MGPKAESEAKTKTKQITEDSSVKKKVSKQVKMDLFITRKSIKRTSSSNSSNSAAGSRRSAALKAKNYSEIESDTESLFELGGATSPLSVVVILAVEFVFDSSFTVKLFTS